MTAATTNLIMPGEGFEEFLKFLHEVPSQETELISQARRNKKRRVKSPSKARSLSPSPSPARVSVPTAPAVAEVVENKKAAEQSANVSKAAVPAAASKPVASAPPKIVSIMTPSDEEWDTNIQALKSYHANSGHCSVPYGRETGSLRSWAERQKKLFASSNLEESKVNQLKELDFDFTVKPLSTRALSTRSVSTSNNVSKRPEPKKEKSSSKKQKTNNEKSTNFQQNKENASPKKAPMVRKSSLVFEDDETWNKSFEALKTYQATHGNCIVPFGKETGALRSWTERQKRLYSSSKLESDRFEKMAQLGLAF